MTFGYTRNEYIASIMSKPYMEISHQSLKHTLGRVTQERKKQQLNHSNTHKEKWALREKQPKKILSMKKDIDKGN